MNSVTDMKTIALINTYLLVMYVVMHSHIHAHTHTNTRIHKHTHTDTQTHTDIQTHTDTDTHKYMHPRTPNKHTYTNELYMLIFVKSMYAEIV